jgi:DMSO reductase anchor subunit
LVLFTTLTQTSFGTFTLWALLAAQPHPPSPLAFVLASLILGTLSALLHLGAPRRAIFSIANFRSSWLSREALLGGAFGTLVLLLYLRRWFGVLPTPLDTLLVILAILFGLTLVYSISRLYMLRTVPAWNNPATPAAFFTTAFLLGAIAVDIFSFHSPNLPPTKPLILLLAIIQLAIFFTLTLYLSSKDRPAADSLRALWTDLRLLSISRIASALLGIALLTAQQTLHFPIKLSFLAYALILLSELLARTLFYAFYRRSGF